MTFWAWCFLVIHFLCQRPEQPLHLNSCVGDLPQPMFWLLEGWLSTVSWVALLFSSQSQLQKLHSPGGVLGHCSTVLWSLLGFVKKQHSPVCIVTLALITLRSLLPKQKCWGDKENILWMFLPTDVNKGITPSVSSFFFVSLQSRNPLCVSDGAVWPRPRPGLLVWRGLCWISVGIIPLLHLL